MGRSVTLGGHRLLRRECLSARSPRMLAWGRLRDSACRLREGIGARWLLRCEEGLKNLARFIRGLFAEHAGQGCKTGHTVRA